jgi:hypothetical protein
METLRPVVLDGSCLLTSGRSKDSSRIVCESPSDLGGILESIVKKERAFVIVEDSWFKENPGTLRKRLMISQKAGMDSFPGFSWKRLEVTRMTEGIILGISGP